MIMFYFYMKFQVPAYIYILLSATCKAAVLISKSKQQLRPGYIGALLYSPIFSYSKTAWLICMKLCVKYYLWYQIYENLSHVNNVLITEIVNIVIFKTFL